MTDTGKWDKKWFHELPLAYKLFWVYILDRCDLAGIWDVNLNAASFFIGSKITIDGVRKYINGQIYEINDKYWLITDFIRFQNGWPLSDKSPVHKKIIELLELKGITINENTLYDRVQNRVCNTPIVIVRVIDEVKVIKEEEPKISKKEQPPLKPEDLTHELKEESPHVYRLGKMLLDNCPDVMQMQYPMSLQQLKELIKKHGADPVEKILKAMQNKGIKYLKQKNCRYTFLTVESWIR